jgi:threonine/homoserine efflux transporter RhtA
MAVKFVTPARTGRRTKRIVLTGSLAAVLITAVMVILSILDVVSGSEMRETLGKSLAVIGVTTLAVLLAAMILRAGRTPTRDQQPAEAGSRHDQ